MTNFDDFDLEVQDEKDSAPEHFNGAVSISGTPLTIIPSSGKVIQLAFIKVPSVRHPTTPNSLNDAIKFSIDGGTTYMVLLSGESQYIPGIFTNLKLDTNVNGTYYEVIVWS